MAITRSLLSQQRAGTPAVSKKASLQTLPDRVHDRPGAAIIKQPQASQSERKRVLTPSAQLRAELENAISSIAPAKELEKAPRFLFVPFPEVNDIAEETDIAIDASNMSDRFLARYPMYNDKNMSMIQQELGKGFASYGMTSTKPYYEIPVLHQGVVTMQHLSHSFKRDVTFRSWEWLQAQLKMVTARPTSASSGKGHYYPTRKPAFHPRKAQQDAMFTDPSIPCIIFLHWTVDPGPSTADLAAIYAILCTLQSSRPGQTIRAFPSQSELLYDQSKIPDIQALDLIASTSPFAYAYRPLTCFTHALPNHNPSTCPLSNHRETVMKRTHSSGGQHVQLISGSRPLPHHVTSSQPYTWFAQSYEPFFPRFGEFRVFITASPSPHSLRNRHGRILSTVITEWVDDHNNNCHNNPMYVRVATAHDFLSPHVSPLRLSDLHAFALHVYERLREKQDWEAGYESLEVGVRLDVGVGVGMDEGGGKEKGEEKRFFVNEITRFYGADYFSQHTLGAPQQEVCWGFAKAMDRFFGVGKEEDEK